MHVCAYVCANSYCGVPLFRRTDCLRTGFVHMGRRDKVKPLMSCFVLTYPVDFVLDLQSKVHESGVAGSTMAQMYTI